MLPRRVLIVDIPIIADSVARILKRSEHRTAKAYSAQSAIKKARRFKPHVIVSSVSLPAIDGFELATVIREENPTCSVLLVPLIQWNEDPHKLIKEANKQCFEILFNPAAPAVIVERVNALCANGLGGEP